MFVLSENRQFLEVKFSIYLNRSVFVMEATLFAAYPAVFGKIYSVLEHVWVIKD